MAILSSSLMQPTTVVFARSKDQTGIHCGEWLTRVLAEHGSRGGGSSEMAQGQVPSSALLAVADTLRLRALECIRTAF
jgi:alanyl-tRNA synthetase